MSHDIQLTGRVAVEGHFTFRAVKVDGSGSRELASFKNLILDQGLARLCLASPGGVQNHVRVGAGSLAPAPQQTALVSQIAAASSPSYTSSFSTSAPYWYRSTRTWRFAAGDAAGNIAEIGVGWAATGATLFSRALVLDANGDPTTVTVLSDEFLDVTYELTYYPSAEDSFATLNLNGTSHAVVSRLCEAGKQAMPAAFLNTGGLMKLSTTVGLSGTAGLVPLTATPSVSWHNVTGGLIAYVPNSFACEVTMTVGLTGGNFAGGITLARTLFQDSLNYQISFDPPIPKTASHIFTFNFRLALTRR